MDSSIFRFILRQSLRQQIVIVLLTLVSLPFYYVSLEIPKRIINKALGADVDAYPHPVRLLGRDVIALEPFEWLLLLCLLFLFAVVVQGGIKYLLNVYKGHLGERLLRELRRTLCARVLRFPLARFNAVSSDELNAIISSEVDPLGGFIGDAVAQPALQGGLLLTAILFIFLQDPLMGLASLALFPIQGYVIPRMQREVNALGRQRIQEVRRLSTRLGEAVEALPDIRSGGHGAYELSILDGFLERILQIRYQLFRRKYFVKFLNNFIFQLTPFMFLLVGGYLVIEQELSIGALVAVLAAYKDLPPPAKELFDYYQEQHDARLKYEQIVSRFMVGAIESEDLVTPPSPQDEGLPCPTLEVRDLTVRDATGASILEEVTFDLQPGERVAVVGPGRAGETLGEIVAGLRKPTRGSVAIDGRRVDAIPRASVARTIAYVAEEPRFFKGSIASNLHYGFDGIVDDAGPALDIAALRAVGLGGELAHFGLNATIDVAGRPDVEQRLLAARWAVRENLTARDERLIEPLDIEHYCHYASVAENLLWGAPLESGFELERLSDHPFVVALLRKTGLSRALTEAGALAARALANLDEGSTVPATHTDSPALIHDDEWPGVRSALDRASLRGVHKLPRADRQLLVAVAFRLVAGVHDFAVLKPELLDWIVEARKLSLMRPSRELEGKLVTFDPARYNRALNLRENLLFSIVVDQRPRAVADVESTVLSVVRDLALEDAVVEAALEFDVGVNGNALSAGQRQRLGIARALLSEPGILLLCRATSRVDPDVEREIARTLNGSDRRAGLVWVLDRPHLARLFDRVLVFDGPRLVEAGTYDELDRPGSHLRSLLGAD